MFTRTRVLGVAIALVFLFLALWKIDLGKLVAALGTANYWFVAPAGLATLFGYVLRTLRWRGILQPARRLGFRQVFPVLMIGFMANNVLPARAGEIVRAYVLNRRAGVGKTACVSTIVVERLLDGLTLILLVALLSLWFPLPDWGTTLARVGGGVFLAGAVIVFLLLGRRSDAQRLTNRVAGLLPRRLADRIRSMFEAALLGFEAVKDCRAVCTIAVLSLLVWAAEALSYVLVIRGFNIALPGFNILFAAIFLLVVVNLAIMLPSAPGYVGTFQAFGVLALSGFGVPREVALAIAIVSHGTQYILVTGIGLICLWRGRLSLPVIATQKATPASD